MSAALSEGEIRIESDDRSDVLEIGAGKVRSKGITVDRKPGPNVDRVMDLTETPWPFPASWFREVRAIDVLEHLPRDGVDDSDSLFRVMAEIHRVLYPGGRLTIVSPHQDSIDAWGTPTHTRVFNEVTFTWWSGSQENRRTRFDYPTFSSMRVRVDRALSLGPFNQFHLRKHTPRLYRVLCALGLGTKDRLYVELVK